MTLKQFETALQQCTQPITWYSNNAHWANSLRGQLPGDPVGRRLRCCPITAVTYVQTGEVYSLNDVVQAAQALGLSTADRLAILRAADGGLDPGAIALRARFRAGLGLPTERGTAT